MIYNDFKVVYREPSLRIFLVLPFLIIWGVYSLLPYLCQTYEVICPYISYILMATMVQSSTMFGFIYCMVFIDEKDTWIYQDVAQLF